MIKISPKNDVAETEFDIEIKIENCDCLKLISEKKNTLLWNLAERRSLEN